MHDGAPCHKPKASRNSPDQEFMPKQDLKKVDGQAEAHILGTSWSLDLHQLGFGSEADIQHVVQNCRSYEERSALYILTLCKNVFCLTIKVFEMHKMLMIVLHHQRK